VCQRKTGGMCPFFCFTLKFDNLIKSCCAPFHSEGKGLPALGLLTDFLRVRQSATKNFCEKPEELQKDLDEWLYY